MNKLKYYGIVNREWKWFYSYLDNRRQYTVYGGCSSDVKRVKFGVPQGGIVSPLLFLLYINDIVNCSKTADCVLYADDTNLFLKSTNIANLYFSANQAISQFYLWFKANNLTLNSKKTNYIIFHRKQRKLSNFNYKLCLEGEEVERVYHTKFLGVVVDANLSWNKHIINLTSKISKYVPKIYRIRSLCTEKSLRLIYNSLIYSNLVYCNTVWGFCRGVALTPLIIAQKKVIRALAGVGYNHHTSHLFSSMKLLTLEGINEYIVAIFVYKCLNSVEFNHWYRYRETEYLTRGSSLALLEVPIISNLHSEQCIKYRGARVWNQIPLQVRSKTYNSFKIELKSLILGRTA